MATTAKSPPPADPATEPAPTGLEDLSRRVAELERVVGGVMSGKAAEISQEEKDRQILATRPNSYPEAVAHKEAEERQAERDKKAKTSSSTSPQS